MFRILTSIFMTIVGIQLLTLGHFKFKMAATDDFEPFPFFVPEGR